MPEEPWWYRHTGSEEKEVLGVMGTTGGPAFKTGTKKTGKKGAQYGNINALKSGAFSDLFARNLDKRTRLAKWHRAVRTELGAAMGGDVSPQQQILIDRIVYKLLRCTLFEMSALTGESSSSDHHYLAWANSLRLDLKALGLDRRSVEAGDLRAYLEDSQ